MNRALFANTMVIFQPLKAILGYKWQKIFGFSDNEMVVVSINAMNQIVSYLSLIATIIWRLLLLDTLFYHGQFKIQICINPYNRPNYTDG